MSGQIAVSGAAALPSAAASAAVAAASRVITQHSRSFSWAARLLPAKVRADAVVLYAWCRRADDAVDNAASVEQARAALGVLQQELDDLYEGREAKDLHLQAFADVVRRTAMPKTYPQELLLGMAMDVDGTRYENHDTFLQYCYRAAGVVGLMMCHVLGVTSPAALRRACHLGMAMQITNICRDVPEDWQLGRLYLPRTTLERHGLAELGNQLGRPLPQELGPQIAGVVRELLSEAAVMYISGQVGLRLLPGRVALAIGVAQAVYADIGESLRRQDYNPLKGRAFTSTGRKIVLSIKVAAFMLLDLPRRLLGRGLPPPCRYSQKALEMADLLPY